MKLSHNSSHFATLFYMIFAYY